MRDAFRKILKAATPKTLKGVLWRATGCCALMVLWHLALDRALARPHRYELLEIVIAVTALGGPFVLLFMMGSWLQYKACKELARRAYYDQLSGSLNRQTFVSNARKAIAETPQGLLLLIDADHFKNINDMFGHATGDRCIAAIGHRLQWHARGCDIAGRVGGEEFAVFLSNVTEQHGRLVATRIGQPVEFMDAEKATHLKVTLSIGATWTTPGQTLEDVFHEADEALYMAKATGRAQLRFSGSDEAILLASGQDGKIGEVVEMPRRVSSKMQLMLGG